jgi:hypothetical protein
MSAINESPWMVTFVALFVVCIFVGFFTLVLGFVFSLSGKEEKGSRFIKFGAECSAIAFLSILVALVDIFLGVLIVYWIIWIKFRKFKINLCPHCGTQITTQQRSKLLKMFGLRVPISCQSCGDNIVLSKWPWRIMIMGLLLFPALLCLSFFKIDFGLLQHQIFYIPLLLILIGHFALKLEVINSTSIKLDNV